ncbi:hypothetical protein [Runella zeae]|uniref:hypothetical protein n=1 Tax=Runella zeae TaxID=94255 RepID=UPI0003F7DA74|nr:hypothetical protein [Runella zeae]
MKHFILIFFLIVVFGELKAQKVDIIYQVNGRQVRAYTLQIKEREAIYRLRNTKNAATYKMPTDSIVKVRYASGRVYYYQIQRLSVRPANILRTNFQQLTIPLQLQKKPKGQKPDLILTKDRRIIECEIIEITDREIKYTALTDDTQKIRTLRRKDVLGYEKNLPEKPKPQPTVIVQKVKQKKIEDTVKVAPPFYKYSSFSLYALGSYLWPTASSKWTNATTGMGLVYAVGGGIIFTQRFNQFLGVHAEAAYVPWQSDYLYKRNGELLFSHSFILRSVPLGVGCRVYPYKRVYLSPSLQGTLFQFVTKSTESNSLSVSPNVQNSLYWGGSVTLGQEVSLGKSLCVDISIRYNHLVSGLPQFTHYYESITAPFGSLEAKLCLGLKSYKKQLASKNHETPY